MKISLVPHGELLNVISEILPFIHKGAEWTLGRMAPYDIVQSMFHPQVMTWIIFDDSSTMIVGYLCTQIFDYPRARHFAVLNCGGYDGMLDDCVDLVFDTFETYARQSGCDGIEIIGRPAWAKFVKQRGYVRPQVQYFKSFKEE